MSLGRRVRSPEPEALPRRAFVKVVAAAGAGLTLGITLEGCGAEAPPTSDATFAPDAWLRIDGDGTIRVLVDRSEMGQGVATALPLLVAEELEVPLERVTFAFAPAHPAYANPAHGMQITGGSTSVSSAWEPLRRAGATARELLREAAARRWDVDAARVGMQEGRAVHPDGRTLGYGELAAAAAALEAPPDPPLKAPPDFRLIGSSPPRLDIPPKTRGEAVFGIDAGPADARVAVVARCPVFGGSLRSYDDTAARAVAGVHDVLRVERGVAVVADGYWAARAGRQALEIEWDEGPASSLDDDEVSRRLRAALDAGGRAAREEGDPDAALAGAGRRVRATYALPYLAHACMEPMSCAAELRDGRLTVWAPTQFQDAPSLYGGGARQAAADAAGLGAGEVDLHTTYLGGGFGRRAERDFVREAAELAARTDAAVRLIWSREDDIRHDYYRPASLHDLEAVLDDDGAPRAWRHDIAVQSITERFMPGWIPDIVASWAGIMPDGIDPTAVEGARNQPYGVPDIRVGWAKVDLPVPVGFWRSVGNSQNGFVVESFVDELAHAAGRDPYEYRRDLLAERPRHRAVLDAAAEASGWGEALPDGRARGIAVVESFGSFVAQVAEVSVDDRGLRVHRVWCAVDCGTVVHPAIVRAQMESGIVYGLTAALHGRIRIREGRVVESNFHDYPMLRIDRAPVVDVVLVPSGDPPGGVGEPGLPPVAPAVTNALFALTGQRIRELPVRLA